MEVAYSLCILHEGERESCLLRCGGGDSERDDGRRQCGEASRAEACGGERLSRRRAVTSQCCTLNTNRVSLGLSASTVWKNPISEEVQWIIDYRLSFV
jgi:hypothetical protein